MLSSAQIRTNFLEFFKAEGHMQLPSASLIPSSYDASVLFTIAGMQQFKPYFLAQQVPPSPRATTAQRCFRTVDIDQVGTTDRHLTFFEMLGNFSFGDYFKPEAIAWAWRLVTEVLGVDADRLWTTVHAGDTALALGPDDEALELWAGQGVPRDRIVKLGADNFWKAGPTGPCGPSSEIYFDRGAEHGCGAAHCKPGCECDRYLEIYNLVFMQYDRNAHGVLSDLPRRNIDTGMGLERIAAVLQGGVSVFEIDSFQPLTGWVERACGVRYGSDFTTTKALRVLADHARAMTFLASDGVLPANEGRGYVLRRVIRRAIQHASRIGLVEAHGSGLLVDLAKLVVEGWGDVNPQLHTHRDAVERLLDAEEGRFLATLDHGSHRFAEAVDKTRARGKTSLSGEDAFQLHDTYGFPIELTTELAAEQALDVDHAGFMQLMEAQRERARAAAGGGDVPRELAASVVRSAPETLFVGYTDSEVATRITALQELPAVDDGPQRLLIKLAASPLYAQGGGQVADRGVVTGPHGRAHVLDVLRFDTDQVILLEVEDGAFVLGEDVDVSVDALRRACTAANHTATHLLHKALRDTLGDHVHQAGSLVAPDRLRFDFTHHGPLSEEERRSVEEQVNVAIADGLQVRWSVMPIDEARDQGAMMLFGEKYGDMVRLVDVGEGFSQELCGGTHVANTHQIRLFVLTHETSVGSSARRIEALTALGAERYLRDLAAAATAAAHSVHVDPADLVERVETLTRRTRELERELSALRSGSSVERALEKAELLGDMHVVVTREDGLTMDELLQLGDRLRDKLAPAAVLLGGVCDGKVSLVATATPDVVAAGVDAGALLKRIAPIVGGGGGGRANLARAGGKQPERLDEALADGATALRDALAEVVR